MVSHRQAMGQKSCGGVSLVTSKKKHGPRLAPLRTFFFSEDFNFVSRELCNFFRINKTTLVHELDFTPDIVVHVHFYIFNKSK